MSARGVWAAVIMEALPHGTIFTAFRETEETRMTRESSAFSLTRLIHLGESFVISADSARDIIK
jgi:hypothetical protein